MLTADDAHGSSLRSGGVQELDAGTDVWARSSEWIVIPTNTEVRRDGTAVMGAGLAAQAASRYRRLPARYGAALRRGQPRLAVHPHRLLLAPTKWRWRDAADPALVDVAIASLVKWCARHPDERVLVPALGCGLGGLSWPVVRSSLLEGLEGCNVALIPPQR